MVTTLLLLLLLNIHAHQNFVGQAIPGLKLTAARGVIDLSFARIDELRLQSPDLVTLRAHGSHLPRMNCSGGELIIVDASDAELTYSRWQKVGIGTADFRGADLTGARLIDLQIGRCMFDGAKLTGTIFTNVQAQTCSFRGATFDRNSVLPFGKNSALNQGMIYVD